MSVSVQKLSLFDRLHETTTELHRQGINAPNVAIVLGSGLAALASKVHVIKTLKYSEIPHFPKVSVAGHSGELIHASIPRAATPHGTPGETAPEPGHEVVLLSGRAHGYEGHTPQEATFPINALASLGIKTILLTNAAGGLHYNQKPGDFVVLRDHINLTGANPLTGPNDERLGPRFPDMSYPYDRALGKILSESLQLEELSCLEGVYCGLAGPNYETAAEIQYLGRIGGDVVGMSTVWETIVARHRGLRVAAVSLISNLGTGFLPTPLSHQEVTMIGAQVTERFTKAVIRFVQSI